MEKINKEQIQDVAVDMMSQIKFDEKRHRYTDKEGKFIAGVTSVCGLLPKDWMPAWGAKSAVKELGYYDFVTGKDPKEDYNRATEILEKIKGMTTDEYLDLLKECKGAFARKRDDASELGSEWHEYLENRIKAIMRNEPQPEAPTGNEWAKSAVERFFEWVEENVSEFVLSEARVANMSEEYAGTLDALVILKSGEPAIIDFKFANNISESWVIQTSAYAKTFDQYGIKVEKRFVFVFPKTEMKEEYDTKTRTYKLVKNEFQVIEYPASTLDFEYQTFIHLRKAMKWINKK